LIEGTDFSEERAAFIFAEEDSSILKTEEAGSFEKYVSTKFTRRHFIEDRNLGTYCWKPKRHLLE
jgi:hypothetical protein